MSGLLVHEWIAQNGGSERVLDQLRVAFPSADVQVLWNDMSWEDNTPRETWLANTPLRRHKALSVPFQLSTWRHLNSAHQYQWMLVSSHLFAHHARVRGQEELRKHVYAHTPARYIWEPELDRRGSSLAVRSASLMLKSIDRKRACDAIEIATNSNFTRLRIQRTWRRDALVIFPPVDVDRIIDGGDWSLRLGDEDRSLLEQLPENYLLGASRMVPYKRLDQVIRAGESTQIPVVLAGDGPLWDELAQLAARSSTRVVMVKSPSDPLLFALYQRARAYVFPALEDFGIMPVEAMAAGAPVIAVNVGGAFESVGAVDGGAFVSSFGRDQWVRAVCEVRDVDRTALPARTRRFSNRRFRDEIRTWIRGAER